MKIDGIEIEIQPSTFANAMALKKAVADALRKDGITLDLKSININDDDILKSDIGENTLGSLVENVLAVATDANLRKALFDCCDKVVLFGNERLQVNASFFEEPDTWGYYYPIMIEVIKVNLTPFFGKLSSMFSGVQELIVKSLKLK